MNSLDLIVLALVLFLGIKGVMRGFVSELSGFIAIVGGVFVASRFGKMMAELLSGMFGSIGKTTAAILAFIVVFALFWFAVVAAAGVIKKFIESMGLGAYDKALGFVVSGGKIFLILSIVIFAFSSISLLKNKIQGMTNDSFLYPAMLKTGSFLINLSPDDLNMSSVQNKAADTASSEINKTIQQAVTKK